MKKLTKEERALSALKHVLERVGKRNPQLAKELASDLAVYMYDNALTKDECVSICLSMTGQDGLKGGKWTAEAVSIWLKKNIFPEHEEGKYNFFALVCAMNMMWSDHTDIIKEIVSGTGEMTAEEICYRLAVDMLKDDDGVFDIRKYFSLD